MQEEDKNNNSESIQANSHVGREQEGGTEGKGNASSEATHVERRVEPQFSSIQVEQSHSSHQQSELEPKPQEHQPQEHSQNNNINTADKAIRSYATGELKWIDIAICKFFGVGSIPFAPGTFGSIAGLIANLGLALVIFAGLEAVSLNNMYIFWAVFIITQIFLVLAASKSVTKYVQKIGNPDPGEIVIDEVIGIGVAFIVGNLVMAFLHDMSFFSSTSYPEVTVDWPYYLLLFLTFRIFDIWKPGPIGIVEKNSNPATAIIMDDVFAGIAAGISTHVLLVIWHTVI